MVGLIFTEHEADVHVHRYMSKANDATCFQFDKHADMRRSEERSIMRTRVIHVGAIITSSCDVPVSSKTKCTITNIDYQHTSLNYFVACDTVLRVCRHSDIPCIHNHFHHSAVNNPVIDLDEDELQKQADSLGTPVSDALNDPS